MVILCMVFLNQGRLKEKDLWQGLGDMLGCAKTDKVSKDVDMCIILT